MSKHCANLLFYQLPSIYMQAIEEVFTLYFTAIEKNYIMMITDSFRIPLHIFIGYLLIVKWKWDLFGCAMTTNLVFLV